METSGMNNEITIKPTATPKKANQQRFDQSRQAFGHHVHFVVIRVRNFVKHRIEFTRLFADVDHVDYQFVDHAGSHLHHVKQTAQDRTQAASDAADRPAMTPWHLLVPVHRGPPSRRPTKSSRRGTSPSAPRRTEPADGSRGWNCRASAC